MSVLYEVKVYDCFFRIQVSGIVLFRNISD